MNPECIQIVMFTLRLASDKTYSSARTCDLDYIHYKYIAFRNYVGVRTIPPITQEFQKYRECYFWFSSIPATKHRAFTL